MRRKGLIRALESILLDVNKIQPLNDDSDFVLDQLDDIHRKVSKAKHIIEQTTKDSQRAIDYIVNVESFRCKAPLNATDTELRQIFRDKMKFNIAFNDTDIEGWEVDEG